jgi:thiaminase
VRVPAVCVQAAQDGAKATALFNQARDALSHFDLTRMRQVFDEATRLERTVQREVQQCQAQQ